MELLCYCHTVLCNFDTAVFVDVHSVRLLEQQTVAAIISYCHSVACI